MIQSLIIQEEFFMKKEEVTELPATDVVSWGYFYLLKRDATPGYIQLILVKTANPESGRERKPFSIIVADCNIEFRSSTINDGLVRAYMLRPDCSFVEKRKIVVTGSVKSICDLAGWRREA